MTAFAGVLPANGHSQPFLGQLSKRHSFESRWVDYHIHALDRPDDIEYQMARLGPAVGNHFARVLRTHRQCEWVPTRRDPFLLTYAWERHLQHRQALRGPLYSVIPGPDGPRRRDENNEQIRIAAVFCGKWRTGGPRDLRNAQQDVFSHVPLKACDKRTDRILPAGQSSYRRTPGRVAESARAKLAPGQCQAHGSDMARRAYRRKLPLSRARPARPPVPSISRCAIAAPAGSRACADERRGLRT